MGFSIRLTRRKTTAIMCRQYTSVVLRIFFYDRFDSAEFLESHTWIHSNENCCPLCPEKTFSNKRYWRDHMRAHSRKNELTCELDDFFKQGLKMPNLTCEECDVSLSSIAQLFEHNLNVHTETRSLRRELALKYQCNQCHKK